MSLQANPFKLKIRVAEGQLPDLSSHTNGALGAVVFFYGVIREMEVSEKLSGIAYTSYHRMLVPELRRLFDRVSIEFAHLTTVEIELYHLLGFVPVGKPSMLLKVATPHRKEAFQLLDWIMDEFKKVIPIWKTPIYLDQQN